MAKASKAKALSQGERFIQAAREIGADENEGVFDKALKKVVSAPPPKTVEKRKAEAKKLR